jgi:hypothetical protein
MQRNGVVLKLSSNLRKKNFSGGFVNIIFLANSRKPYLIEYISYNIFFILFRILNETARF